MFKQSFVFGFTYEDVDKNGNDMRISFHPCLSSNKISITINYIKKAYIGRYKIIKKNLGLTDIFFKHAWNFYNLKERESSVCRHACFAVLPAHQTSVQLAVA